jgi:predicted acetyltransferase
VEPERSPFLVRVDGKLAGFVLVARYDYLTGIKDTWVMAEFFIMRKYRLHGIGEYVACHIFNQFPGDWQVGQINKILQQQRRKVIARYSQNFKNTTSNNETCGPIQVFTPCHSGIEQGDLPDGPH